MENNKHCDQDIASKDTTVIQKQPKSDREITAPNSGDDTCNDHCLTKCCAELFAEALCTCCIIAICDCTK